MRLATRLRIVEAKLRPDDQEPRLVIVLAHDDGVWRDGQGNALDPATLDPRTRVIRLRRRPDGPQEVPAVAGVHPSGADIASAVGRATAARRRGMRNDPRYKGFTDAALAERGAAAGGSWGAWAMG